MHDMDPNISTLKKPLISMLTWLRDGAIVAGSEQRTADFRERCLEQAYMTACQDLTPALVALGVLGDDDQRLNNLIDISAMVQKAVITRASR